MSWQKHRKTIIVASIVAIGLWVVVLCITLGVFFCGAEGTASRWGQFGDAFGVVNALFSGLALLGVIAAVLLQREDLDASLKAQRETNEAQRTGAKIAALAAALEAKSRARELFEKERTEKRFETASEQSDLAEIACQIIVQQVMEINSILDNEVDKLQPGFMENVRERLKGEKDHNAGTA